MRSRIVILTTHFGNNFSGGSTATCEIFSRLENEFKEITVLGTKLGNHSFKELRFIKYRSWFHAIHVIKSLDREDTIFYGDFYNSFLFILANVPFYFTYHDNWPELGGISVRYKLIGIYYWFIYRQIFNSAKSIVVVSEFRKKTAKNLSKRVILIRNGVKDQLPISKNKNEQCKILMVGNIDVRKYKQAIAVFEKLKTKNLKLKIDIYGHIKSKGIAKRISAFHFVKLKGYLDQIPYKSYDLMLHTSQMENLSIAWCEAINNGVPVVTFSVGGAEEIINETNGVLIDPYNIDQMVITIQSLVQKNRFNNDRVKLGKEYSWQGASEKYKNLFDERANS